MPRFSVVVPTRDRPDLLEYCLESLADQTLDDVEVIVADNPLERPAREVFERWKRSGWRYLRAEEPLPMYENWERACAATSGDYVTVLIDKTVLHPSALELANRAVTDEPRLDVVTWWNEGYAPLDESGCVGRGSYAPTATTRQAAFYDPRAELAEIFANKSRRGSDPIHYCRGKIVFGAFSRRLLATIESRTGRVFHPLSPDYTSRIPALAFGKCLLDLGRPLLVSYNSARSNGRRVMENAAYAHAFISGADPRALDALPIPGLYASSHNVVAYDLVTSAARCPSGSVPELDLANLVRRAREDLHMVRWIDPAEREHQYSILEAEEARLNITPAPPAPEPPPRRTSRRLARNMLVLVPPAQRPAYWLGRRLGLVPLSSELPAPIFKSPVDAARAADRHYAACAIDP